VCPNGCRVSRPDIKRTANGAPDFAAAIANHPSPRLSEQSVRVMEAGVANPDVTIGALLREAL